MNNQIIEAMVNFLNTPKEQATSFDGKYILEFSPSPTESKSSSSSSPSMFWTVEITNGNGYLYPNSGDVGAANITIRHTLVYKVLQKLSTELAGSISYETESKVSGTRVWRVDFKDGLKGKKPSTTVKLSSDTLRDLLLKKTEAQSAFLKGLIKVNGDLALAMRMGMMMDQITHQIKEGKL